MMNLALIFLVALGCGPACASGLTIVVGDHASPVEKHAAQELAKFVRALYKFSPELAAGRSANSAQATILVGSPAGNKLIAELAGKLNWDSLSEDGFFLKTVATDPDVVLAGGRSGRATLFAVYELVERWGVQFSLSGDMIPSNTGPFRLARFDEKLEPVYPIRAVRPVNNLPEGSAAWDLLDFQRFIDQMAKLKFNTFVFVIMESGPWLDYDFRGLRRPAGDIFYGWRYPIDEQFVGKELFRGKREFYSPVLGRARDENERKQLGIGLVRSALAYAKQLGLMTGLVFGLLEPPTAFKHRFNEWATLPLPDPKDFPNAQFMETPAEELGTNPNYAAWMNVKDPVMKELTEVRVRALIDTYPDANFYFFWVSEHRAGVVDYRQIYKELDARYHFDFDLQKTLDDPGDFAYGKERYQDQIKGDVLFLYLFDQLFRRDCLLENTSAPHARIALAGVMPRLGSLVSGLLSDEWLYAAWPEYGTHAVADRIHVLDPVLRAGVPTTVEIGINDDNSMWFPQINVESLHRIVEHTSPLGLKGYVTTLWQVRQSDINAAYLARASWRPELETGSFYQDYLSKLVGRAAAPDFERALRTIEAVDRDVKKNLYGFAFAFEGALASKLNGVNRSAVARIRPEYLAAERQLRCARPKATARGRAHVEFWLKRTQLAVQWLDLGLAASELGRVLGEARRPGAPLIASQQHAALAAVDRMQHQVRAMIEIIVSDARSPGDLGQIASMNRYIYEYLAALRSDLAGRSAREP